MPTTKTPAPIPTTHMFPVPPAAVAKTPALLTVGDFIILPTGETSVWGTVTWLTPRGAFILTEEGEAIFVPSTGASEVYIARTRSQAVNLCRAAQRGLL